VAEVAIASPGTARTFLGPPTPVWARDFANLDYEWRRIFAEFVGTFFLLLVAAGAGVVNAATGGSVGRTASVVAPALMVMAIILAFGAVSGAHLNPVVSIAFALRGEFPWRRVPLYLVGQIAGGLLACLFLRAVFGTAGGFGSTIPGLRISDPHAVLIEAVLTCGLVTTILGTASGAQNVGTFSAIGVAGYIALAGLWASPASGASMNPVRSFAPDAVSGNFGHIWVYLVGPPAGMLVAVAIAHVLRGQGGDAAAARAAQGTLGTVIIERADPKSPQS
jgi:aquaporin Z